jgi:HAD superfamily hydrolase (TIGR01509 family)
VRLDPARVRAVLFDLDGVLVDSYEVWFHLVNHAARALGAAPVSRETFHACWGQGVVADVERLFPMTTVETLSRFYADHFADHLAHLRVDPDAPAVLAALARGGLVSAVVTNTPQPLAGRVVALAGVALPVVGGTDVARPKPAPDMLEEACRRLGVDVPAGVMVGDSRHDLAAARAAGVPCVGVRLDADARIERLGDLPALLGVTSRDARHAHDSSA